MKARLLALLILGWLLFAAGFYLYDRATMVIWDGGFDLTVYVTSKSGQPRAVMFQGYLSCSEADFWVPQAGYYAKNWPPPDHGRLWSVTSSPFDGKPLIVNIPLSGKTSGSGRQLSRWQMQHAVVYAELADGRGVGQYVTIPDCRESRELRIELP